MTVTVAGKTGAGVVPLTRETMRYLRLYVERERKTTAERLAHLMRHANDMILLTDASGRIVEANDLALESHGYSMAELQRMTLEALRSPASRTTYGQDRTRLMTHDGAVFEAEHQRKDGTTFPVEVSARLVQIGGTTHQLNIIRDITERKRAEEALRQAEEKYRAIFENAVEGIYQSTPDGRILSANPAMAAIHGYASPEEFIADMRNVARQLYVDPRRRDEFKRLMEEQGRVSNFQSQVRRKDGSLIWVSGNARAVRDASGRILYYEGTVQDITDLKRAQEELQRLAARHEAILSEIPDIVMETDIRRVYTWANPAGYEFFGEDVIGKEAAYYFAGEQDTYAQVEPLFKGDIGVFYVESWQRRKDGQRRLLAWWCRALKDAEGRVTGALSTARDITDLKRTEQALRDNEERLKLALDTAALGTWDWDLRTGRIIWGGHHERLFGFAPGTFEGSYESFISRVHPDDREGIKKALDFARDNHTSYEQEYRVVWPDGSVRWMAGKGAFTYDASGKPVRMTGALMDITDRKRAEEERTEMLARFTGFAEASQYGMGMAELDGRIIFVNRTLANMLGESSADDCLGKHFPTAYYPELMTRKLQEEVIPALMRDGHWHGKLELLTVDGRRVPTDENYFVIRDEHGRPRYLADILTDITERKRVERELRESEERFRSLSVSSPLGIFLADPEGRCIYVNPRFRALFGHTLKEIVGQGWLRFVSDEDRADVEAAWQDTVRRQEEFVCEFRLSWPHGEARWMRLRASPTFSDERKLTGYVGTVEDITEQVQAQDALRTLTSIFDHTADYVLQTNPHGQIT
ncbi:MAG: PAS domain S-box protein, partial [Verrucomicrobiae bacterium]|nr:PAS domain S-box protein [Verrucomicrobiae bacterium]